MSGISFDLPLYRAEIYHSDRGKTNPWNRVLNFVAEVGDTKEETERKLHREVVKLFEEDGYDPIRIETTYIEQLHAL